jgi:hypothetical protein
LRPQRRDSLAQIVIRPVTRQRDRGGAIPSHLLEQLLTPAVRAQRRDAEIRAQ